MKRNFINLFNIAFLILQIAGDIIYMVVGNPYVWKVFASLTFFFGGVVNLVYVLTNKEDCGENKNYKYFMLVGLFFAMLGDIVLIDYFAIGAVLFAIGHIWFFIAYCTLYKVNAKDIICSLIIFVLALIVELCLPIFDYNGMLALVIVYAFIISFMLGKAISNIVFNGKNVTNLIIVAGSVLFFLSDLMLLFDVFGNVGMWADRLCLIFYYPAEFLLAISIYYASKTKAKADNFGNLNK